MLKTQTTWIFMGECLNADFSVVDIVGVFEATWIWSLDLHLFSIISDHLMGQLIQDKKQNPLLQSKTTNKSANFEPLQISLPKCKVPHLTEFSNPLLLRLNC